MDTPLALSLKLGKFEFSDWIMSHCRPDLLLEDDQGLLPIQLAIQRNNLSFVVDMFDKMRIERIVTKAQVTGRTNSRELSQEKVIAWFADCVKFGNFEVFKWLLELCSTSQPR